MNYVNEKIFKILSCTTSKNIIIHLYVCKCLDCSVEKICSFSNSKQANISKHLMNLRKHKIVCFEKRGKFIKYELENEFINKYEDILNLILKTENHQYCNCC